MQGTAKKTKQQIRSSLRRRYSAAVASAAAACVRHFAIPAGTGKIGSRALLERALIAFGHPRHEELMAALAAEGYTVTFRDEFPFGGTVRFETHVTLTRNE